MTAHDGPYGRDSQPVSVGLAWQAAMTMRPEWERAIMRTLVNSRTLSHAEVLPLDSLDLMRWQGELERRGIALLDG